MWPKSKVKGGIRMPEAKGDFSLDAQMRSKGESCSNVVWLFD